MSDCIFCEIVKGSKPSFKIYEDDKVLAILDINPVNLGHTLLIPKKHYQSMTDVPDDLVSYMYVVTKKLMINIKEATGADHVVNTVSGLDILHFHIHIIPRYFNDGLAAFWPTKHFEINEMNAEAEKIKKFI